jgi:hypothetical protein
MNRFPATTRDARLALEGGMHKRAWAVVILAAGGLLTACTGLLKPDVAPEKLFFAMQIEERGRVIARPKLVGETGRALSMRLVDPRRPERTRLALRLQPERAGDGYKVQIGLSMPDRADSPQGELSLLHGEERRLVLSEADRPINVRLMLMRVDSPEFDAYMQIARRNRARRTS